MQTYIRIILLGSYKVGDSTFYSLIENHANSSDFGSLEKIFDRMKRERRLFIEKNFILVFKAYGKAHLPEKAGLESRALEFHCDVINAMNILPNVLTFNLVIKAKEMPLLDCAPDVFTYCTLMDGLCKENRIDDAVLLLDEMQVEGCNPSPVTFNVLINGLCKKVTWAVQQNLMVQDKCVPNDVTYGTIINGLVKQGRAVDGVLVLVSMEERGYHANEYVYSVLGCKPNTVVFSALIDGLCREGKPDEAKEILYEMVKQGCTPNAFTYSSLMRGFFKTGNSHKALLVCYSVLINGLCEDGNLKEAMMVWKQMFGRGYRPDVVSYSSMIHGFCCAGLVELGLRLFNEMLCLNSASQPDVITYNILLHALCKQDRISRAIDLLNCMLDQGCDPDLVTCNILLNALKEKVEPPQDGSLFLDELVIRLYKRQRIIAACNIVEVMLRKFLPLRTSTWEMVLQGLFKRRKIQSAIDKCWNDLFCFCW
ncbi:hypothetical protein NMG60_11021191 [Bertholletia excelsa]